MDSKKIKVTFMKLRVFIISAILFYGRDLPSLIPILVIYMLEYKRKWRAGSNTKSWARKKDIC